MRDVAFIALGSNLGRREDFLAVARAEITRLPSTKVLAVTDAEETLPFGPPGQGNYLNQMIAIETELEPHALLARLHAIEERAGRTRATRWGPRTLDLDIVKFARQTVKTADLVVPHPGLRERDFWQRELAQLESLVDA